MNRISYATQVTTEKVRCPVADDVSRRILDEDAASGPPRYLRGYELAWPRLDACASGFLLPADVFIIHHADDFTTVRENQKTYRRLFGMIFFGASFSMLTAIPQWLLKLKNVKKSKKSKAKMKIVWSKTCFTCQNALKRAWFFCQY